MTAECCRELKELLEKYEDKEDVADHDFFIFARTINESSRQCKCLLRNPALIVPLSTLLKKFYTFCVKYTETVITVDDWNNEFLTATEQLYQAVCKSFQLQYPLYQAYECVKNNFEVTDEQKQAIGKFCDITENPNASELLFENIADFCEKGGIEKINNCFKAVDTPLPLSLSSNLISIIAQLRTWMHDHAIIQLIKPMSGPVTRYLCNIHEDELRLMSARATAELMLNTVKVQEPGQVSYDIDILNIAFKYFMSTTLAVRMAGLNLITNQIHSLLEVGQSQMYGGINSMCSQLASWLNEKEMIEHLFGPNYHVELIKQSQFLLNFLAQERQLKAKHLDCLWSAAQLKHISRYVLDLLITLAKTMDLVSVQYLLQLIAKLPIASHTKQTLLLSSLLTRNIWTAGLIEFQSEEKSASKITPKKLTFPVKPTPTAYKQLNVSPIQSPSLSSDGSTDEEIADIHARRFTGTQIKQLRSLDLKITDHQIRTLTNDPYMHISPSPIESCLIGSQSSGIIAEVDDAISSTNTNGSSASDRERDIMEDLEEESSLASIVNTPLKRNEPIEFNIDSLCEPGNTLLWDLIQDPSLESLQDSTLDEIQKLLWQLICYSGNKKVRMVFIKGCLENIKKNRSVIVSFKILPKILSIFPHSNNSSESSKLLSWAVKDLELMDCFFENLKAYTTICKNMSDNDDAMNDREQQIRARLDFLTAMFSIEITPDHFRLTIGQLDCLWFCLVTEVPEAYHFLILNWLLKQTNSEELHALGLDSFKHIFVKKLPELNAEKMTITGLNLFQKLFGLTRLSNASPFAQQETETEEYKLGTEQLWNIALKAEKLHVANEAMSILNHLYLTVGDSSVRKEKEFVQKCMSVLNEAVSNLEANCLQSLRLIQQVLKILRNHLETYSKRFAFHLELWRLNGKNLNSHQCVQKPNSKDHVLRICCQISVVMTEKVTFKMLSSDLLSCFRAQVTYWCVSIQKERGSTSSTDNTTILKPPFRLITHGHELTPDFDMKTLAELGMRDQQLVYISVTNVRKDRMTNQSQLPPSLQPPPNFESVPMIQLLKEDNFKQIFNLLDVLYKVTKMDDYRELWVAALENRLEDSCFSENSEQSFEDPHEIVKQLSADHLLYNAWELILMLPTNSEISNKFMQLEFDLSNTWDGILNFEQKFKLLYTLQVLDGLSLPLMRNTTCTNTVDSSGDSDSSLSDGDKNSTASDKLLLVWINKLFENGFVKHLLNLLLSDTLEPKTGQDEWSLNCVAYIIKLLTRIGLANILPDEEPSSSDSPSEDKMAATAQRRHVFRARYRSTEADNAVVIHQFNKPLLELLSKDVLYGRLVSLLSYVSENAGETSNIGSQDVRASVVYHCLSFLVCWVSSQETLRDSLIEHQNFSTLLIQLVFFSPQRSVRTEASRGMYKLCVSGGQDVLHKILNLLLGKLQELVSLRKELRLQGSSKFFQSDKIRSSSSNYKDYFWLLCRLINKYQCDSSNEVINIRTAILQVSMFIQDDEQDIASSEGHVSVDYCLIGLLQACTALLQHDTEFKNSSQGYQLMRNIFHRCLFSLPKSSSENVKPRCDTKSGRQAAYDLLLQLVNNSKEMYLELQGLFLRHHSVNPRTQSHCCYGWNYWPHDQERSNVGYVGLINLGATCYMASCMQQLFMIPEARRSILETSIVKDTKHPGILKEIQKMFAYQLESIRKSYNPRSFCKTYTMDKQPLNTGEQKDMTEFFTDLVSKIEEMGVDLRHMIRELFCGVITNNVISLDCPHVSKTEEEFYSVRCTVADMKNLYESLDEVTVKDVLEGDNKYTCSQCEGKVRAEKRACFKSLPKVMCFNTMRYTFNMVTMMKEKVNTHFSFPMKLNMAAYTEEYLLTNKGVGDPDDIPGHWYNLAGVVVHTGTAEGGHYYSFIRDRTSRDNSWYLFNDAEVKSFDPSQIAAECFGGEMTTKTFDAMTEKYMDFSFEKTHSAYMLFYEHSDMEKQARKTRNIKVSKELQDGIWEDNYQFLQDKLVFEPSYFNFIWQFCNSIPKTIPSDIVFHSTKLAISFFSETLLHSREKPNMKGWVELLRYGFEHSQSACEWFLDNMAQDDWWLQQLFIRCPGQSIRQMFGQLCLIAIKNLRPRHVQLYNKTSEEEGGSDEENGDVGSCSPITRFIRTILLMLEDNLKSYCKNLPELFYFLYQFLSLGHEECAFMLNIDAISTMVQFYSSLKASDLPEPACDEDEDLDVEDDEILSLFPEDKFYPSALEKMIGSIALLLEEARDGPELHLSDADMQCFVSNTEFPFIYQITADAVNLRQTANIIFHLSRYNKEMADMMVNLLLNAAQKLPIEQSQPFYKLLSLLTEIGENGLPGLPSFMGLVLPKIWTAAEYNPALTLDWLSTQVPRHKQAHQFVLQNLDRWVEKYLIADNSPRIRGGAAYLLVSLVPNHNFPQAFRGRLFAAPQKEIKMTTEAKSILHEIYTFLLNLLPTLKKYCDKTHSGTTKLVNYFTVLNYCCISKEEKAMFTPFSGDMWKLYHPIMSEPDIAVHFNKQALLTFWYHVCDGFEENVKYITDTEDVATNIAYNYILSNDDQEVISYNNSTLPVYYGLMRLACCYSVAFCKNLSSHPNMTWAFEHLMPRSSHYPQVVDELLQMIKLFSGATYKEKEDIELAFKFRRKAIELFCGCMDGQHSWMTLINILKILIESEEDCVHVVCNNGLNPLGEAFSTLHLMYHEATACNVTKDILEVSTLLHTILECCHSHSPRIPEAYKALHGWMERTDIMMKALSMLNSFVPKDIRKICLDLLTILLQIYPEECVDTIVPIIQQSHMTIRMTQTPAPVGPFFPRLGGQSKPTNRKASLRSNGPELNMTLHPSLIESSKGTDKEYELQLSEYYEGYHVFVDKLCRYGLNLDDIPSMIIEISCMLAVEVLPLKLPLFPKLWQEVYNKSSENVKYQSCMQRLFMCESFIEFLDTIFTDERELFDINVFYSFVCIMLPQVQHKVLFEQKQSVFNMIMSTLVADVTTLKNMSSDQFEEICSRVHGDVRALCLLLSVTRPGEVKVPQLLQSCIRELIERYNQHKEALDEKKQKNAESKRKLEQAEKKEEDAVSSESKAGSSKDPEEKENNSEKEGEPPAKKKKCPTDDKTSPSNDENDTTQMKEIEKDEKEAEETVKAGSSKQPDDEKDFQPAKRMRSESSDRDFSDDSSSGSSDDTSSKSSCSDTEKAIPTRKLPNVTDSLRKTCDSLVRLLSRRKEKENTNN